SQRLWRDLAADLGPDTLEWEPKGGLVVATDGQSAAGLVDFAARQADAGVTCDPVASDALADYEPHLRVGLPQGVWYPDDQQVQPVRAAAALLRAAVALGATVRFGARVTGLHRSADGSIRGVDYDDGAGRRDGVTTRDDAAHR